MPKQALANYNKAIQLNPHSADAYYGRGNVYATMGIFDQAAKDFEKALKINPHHLGAERSQQLLNKLQAGQNAE
jgi:tetratricopeptide (TPR) repeat protein